MDSKGYPGAGDYLMLGLARTADAATTAEYFERAAVAQKHRVVPYDDLSELADFAELDALLIFDPWLRDIEKLVRLPCPTIGYLIDTHRTLDVRILFSRYLDQVFIAQPDHRNAFNAIGHPYVDWMPLACDPAVHFKPGLTRKIDVAFVGKLDAPGSERHGVLKEVLSAFETNDYSRAYTPDEMGEIYSSAKIVLNKSINGDVNMRFFEALASGALLVTDRIGNGLDKLGQAGIHYVVYDGAEEAKRVIAHYLQHDAERLTIAQAGQNWVFESHTYDHRLRTMLAALDKGISAAAPARHTSPMDEARQRSQWYRQRGVRLGRAVSTALSSRLDPTASKNAFIGYARHLKRQLVGAHRSRRLG